MIGEVSIIATDHDMKVIYVIYIYIYIFKLFYNQNIYGW